MSKDTNRPPLWTRNYMLAFGANLMMFFSFYLLVPILPFYVMDDLDTSKSVAGVILSLYTISALLIRPFSGYMVDIFARKPLYLICYSLFAVVFAGYIVGGTLTIFIILRIVHGFAFGVNSVSGSTLAIDIMPSERRGEGIGYFGMSSSIAMALGPMVGLMLYDNYSNFDLMFLTSFSASIVGLIAITAIKAPVRVVSKVREVVSLDRFVLVQGMHLFVVLFFIGVGYGVVITYIGLYAKQMGFGSQAGLFFTLQAVGIIASRILSAKSVNKGKLSTSVYSGVALLVTGYTIFVSSESIVAFYACALILGLGYGFITPAFQTMFINLAPHNRRGTANSTYFTAWDLGIGTGIATGGTMATYLGFTALYAYCGIGVLVGFLYFRFKAWPYYLEKTKSED